MSSEYMIWRGEKYVIQETELVDAEEGLYITLTVYIDPEPMEDE